MIEQELKELTAAVKELTAAIRAQTGAAPNPVTAPLEDIKPAGKKPQADSVAETPKSEPTLTPKSEPTSSAHDTTGTSTSFENASDAVTYEDVQKATLALVAARGRDAAVSVLKAFNVTNGKHLTPAQWAPYVEAATRAMEA